MDIESVTPILRLNEVILRRLTTFIVTPDWDNQAIPDFRSFFALAGSCRSLRLALIRPDEDEGYWRSILLDVGQGRACQQASFTFDGKEVVVPFRRDFRAGALLQEHWQNAGSMQACSWAEAQSDRLCRLQESRCTTRRAETATPSYVSSVSESS
jgi:hypothetical protein